MQMAEILSCALPRPILGANAIITASVLTSPSVSRRFFIILSGCTTNPPSMYFACANAPAV